MLNTRNYPNGTSSLLGSHMNQLDPTENRGTYWISRLLEQFGCKLCIGGHKHTYALSYPIKENYQWRTKGDNGEYGDYKNSFNESKYLTDTLEDESGANPTYDISWVLTVNRGKENNPYNVGIDGDISISSTKVPYIPSDLYNAIGAEKFKSSKDYYRCCTPVVTTNDKYDGFVNYSMCQATGYKLKSNKELPCAYQVFSKLIPMTSNVYKDNTFKDTVNENQLYPMYSVLEFKHDTNNIINAIDVKLCRIKGIFKENGKDSFTQTSYGTSKLNYDGDFIDYLIEVNKNNIDKINSLLKKDIENYVDITLSNCMYGVWIPKGIITGEDFNKDYVNFSVNKYLYIKY